TITMAVPWANCWSMPKARPSTGMAKRPPPMPNNPPNPPIRQPSANSNNRVRILTTDLYAEKRNGSTFTGGERLRLHLGDPVLQVVIVRHPGDFAITDFKKGAGGQLVGLDLGLRQTFI